MNMYCTIRQLYIIFRPNYKPFPVLHLKLCRNYGDGPGASEKSAVIKKRILDSSLKFVPSYGWTTQAVVAGAEVEGFPGISHGLFPNGGLDLVTHFYEGCNKDLEKWLREKSEGKDNLGKLAEDAIQQRLRMIVPYVHTWPDALALLAWPENLFKSIGLLGNLVDDIAFYSGNSSANFSWYTKRLELTAAYVGTELYFIQDKSEDFHETWRFLGETLKNISEVSSWAKFVRNFQYVSARTVWNTVGLKLP